MRTLNAKKCRRFFLFWGIDETKDPTAKLEQHQVFPEMFHSPKPHQKSQPNLEESIFGSEKIRAFIEVISLHL